MSTPYDPNRDIDDLNKLDEDAEDPSIQVDEDGFEKDAEEDDIPGTGDDDLEALLDEGVKLQKAAKDAKLLGTRARRGQASEAEMSEWRRLEEARQWKIIGSVALIHHQHCLSCGADHRLFMGWMTEQKHLTDPFARRLVKGMAVNGLLPLRTEVHEMGATSQCASCVDSFIKLTLEVRNVQMAGPGLDQHARTIEVREPASGPTGEEAAEGNRVPAVEEPVRCG